MSRIIENNYTIKQSAPTVSWLTFNSKNKKGETLIIELSLCKDDPNYKNSLPKLWYKNGYIDRVLETYWSINTYVRDSEGTEWGKYNPQHKLSNNKNGIAIDFNWMMEATEENKQKLIDEVYRIFSEATGKSATEEKIDRIKEFAKKNNLEVVTKKPEGWIEVKFATDPCGSVSVCNMDPSFKAIREGVFKRKLLLL